MTSRPLRARPRLKRFGLARLVPLALLPLLVFAVLPASAADDVGEMTNTCSVSGGTSGGDANSFSCCWPGWGCVYCNVDNGTINADQCWVSCDTQACSDANARDRLDLPPPKKPPATKVPGTTPGTVAPQQTPKPKLPTAPGTDTVQ